MEIIRGSELYEKALEGAKKVLNRDGYAVKWDNGFECDAGRVDLIAVSDWDLAFVDVLAYRLDEDEGFPASVGRADLAEIEAAFKKWLSKACPEAVEKLPIGRVYIQVSMNVIQEKGAFVRCAIADVVDGVASFTDDEVEEKDLSAFSAEADPEHVSMAKCFLERRGWEILLPQGYSCKAGGVDLVAEDFKGRTVFVKVLWGGDFSDEGGVRPYNRAAFERILSSYTREENLYPAQARFDLVHIVPVGSDRGLIRHHMGFLAS